jgi:hypothetical protein
LRADRGTSRHNFLNLRSPNLLLTESLGEGFFTFSSHLKAISFNSQSLLKAGEGSTALISHAQCENQKCKRIFRGGV